MGIVLESGMAIAWVNLTIHFRYLVIFMCSRLCLDTHFSETHSFYLSFKHIIYLYTTFPKIFEAAYRNNYNTTKL